jgi:hypothetical protein
MGNWLHKHYAAEIALTLILIVLVLVFIAAAVLQ